MTLFQATGKQAHEVVPRHKDDFYATPPEVTRAFLWQENERLRGNMIWEPACGDGAIARQLSMFGFGVEPTDKTPRFRAREIDFFEYAQIPPRTIVTNPPYKEMTAKADYRWLRHCFDLGAEYVALLLNLNWMCGGSKLPALLDEHPISRIYVLRWRIDFTGKGAPPHQHAWYVWDKHHEGETVLRFLDKP